MLGQAGGLTPGVPHSPVDELGVIVLRPPACQVVLHEARVRPGAGAPDAPLVHACAQPELCMPLEHAMHAEHMAGRCCSGGGESPCVWLAVVHPMHAVKTDSRHSKLAQRLLLLFSTCHNCAPLLERSTFMMRHSGLRHVSSVVYVLKTVTWLSVASHVIDGKCPGCS